MDNDNDDDDNDTATAMSVDRRSRFIQRRRLPVGFLLRVRLRPDFLI